MKVLRVGMTYPRDIEPGVGLHNYYHSYYSNNQECIITTKRPGVVWANREGVSVIQIEINNSQMGVYDDGIFKRIKLLFKKIIAQYRFYRMARPHIKMFNPDIIHLYTPIPILCGLYARRKCKSKIVMSLHGSDAYRISKERFLSFLLRIPDVVVSVSENTESVLSGVKLNQEIICIGNGVDLNVFRNTHSEREKQFIHVANLRWQKGQEYLLRAFSIFHKTHCNYKLIIIGSGEEKEKLCSLCKALNIDRYVEFRGTQGREYIAEELNKSKAFVLTSVTEGFPKVIIEAMATGTPVISTDVGNVKNVVGESGIIVESKDVDGIYNAMEKIVLENKQWLMFSQRAEEKAKSYGWEDHVSRLQKVYEDVLNG